MQCDLDNVAVQIGMPYRCFSTAVARAALMSRSIFALGHKSSNASTLSLEASSTNFSRKLAFAREAREFSLAEFVKAFERDASR